MFDSISTRKVVTVHDFAALHFGTEIRHKGMRQFKVNELDFLRFWYHFDE